MTNNESRRKAQRQARGLRSVDSILHAAADVFVEVGYVGATTNLIANRAAMSPGSLYQFFPNKDAIAYALANHYIEQLHGFYEQLLALNFSDMDLAATIDNLIDPLVAFNQKNPAFYLLSVSTQYAPPLAAILKDFHGAVIQYIKTVIAYSIPAASPEDQARAAIMMHRMFLAIIPLVLDETRQDNRLILKDMKAIFVNYLSSLV